MTVKAFKGTVHVYILNGKERKVVDPRSIPSEIRDALCQQHDYSLPSIIGPNHDVAHFDVVRQGWRDMRYADRKHTFGNQSITYADGVLSWV